MPPPSSCTRPRLGFILGFFCAQKWRQLSAELHCGLTAYVELWDRYNVGLDIVHRIFHYLVRPLSPLTLVAREELM